MNYVNKESGPKPKKMKFSPIVTVLSASSNENLEAQKQLLATISIETEMENREQIANLMEETFELQLLFMIRNPSVENVQREWKFLLEEPHIYLYNQTKT